MTTIATVAELPPATVAALLERARSLAAGASPHDHARRTIGLVFLDTSLRTRTGFAAAAARLGATAIEVVSTRGNAVSMPESWPDTVRTVAGYCDVLVARVAHAWADQPVPRGVRVPVVNAGDTGPRAEHPTQALVDVFAIEQLVGPVPDLRVALCGDLRMRAARSLLTLLDREPPHDLVLVTDPALEVGLELPEGVVRRARRSRLDDLEDVDVLYVVGMPHLALPEDDRTRLRVTRRHLDGLSERGVVLCPLPVIDEMEREVLDDPRMRAFEQSDLALWIRIAVLEWLLASDPGQRIS